ncbi:MAG: tRNA preQ1(34) S-adenosylmethionine ribosyltransferase-isomerase QueA [Saprospiraceae bacterium]|nr:tRNA preQ1(34) S-adenosylmethionine ribosyltransferase-isomerase QueA [Saprospiraceae bacterium]
MRTKLSQFGFELPKKLIAQYPAPNRDESRMMVIHRDTGKIEHRVFKDIMEYFGEGDVMIFNNTKVFPARLYGQKEKTGAKIEVFLLRELNHDARLWDVLVDPARKIRVGNKLYFSDDNDNEVLVAEVVDNTTSRGRTIRFLYDGPQEDFERDLYTLGNTPLPKYITRPAEDSDKERFQTVYAKEVGAVAAPTAGLHFSKELLKRLEIKGLEFAELTLHVGLGTFRPIEVEDLSKHKMDAEYFKVPQKAVDVVNVAKEGGHKVCSIGTTTMRAIETSVSAERLLKPAEGWTNKFIFPPYDFSIADAMVTNFHLPKSSLLIMVCAFGGFDLVMEAYQEAIKEEYNFFSYGDSMLII